ncbi:Zn-ribbon domain-containing OB-fold protein [Mycobacterium kyogaense]|uniref:Zn-ribbon domain-containing OB-fold protein n=1 Tax=Mycobacterium kyogaense TaxID=2212479 RepID=UPI000DAC1C08|nr:OB-fold domain-containing protein [Mycobacterium kyogaense]
MSLIETVVAEEHLEVTDGQVSLVAARCRGCGATVFPSQPSCPRCTASDMARWVLPPQGLLWSYTIQRFPPKAPYDGAGRSEFDPYGVGYVDFDVVIVEGRLTTAAPAELRIGQAVKVVLAPYATDEDGRVLHTFAFEPVGNLDDE